jgi:ubiquinone/menaquinone biosynthesis C-methylase UbiE
VTQKDSGPKHQKESLVENWDRIAPAWNRWAPTVDAWFRPATDRLLDALQLRPAKSVLEVAAGSGGFTAYLARSVGPPGRVVATDSGPSMVRLIEANARRARWTQVESRVMDGEAPDVPPASFDAVTCRQGFMFFAEPARALDRLRATLRPGGRIALSVFSTPDRNPLIALPMAIVARYAATPDAGSPRRGGPGPFSLGEPGQLDQMLSAARFEGVRSEVVACPLRIPSVPEMVRFLREIAIGELEKVPEATRATIWGEIADACRPFAEPTGPGAPCELLVVSGRRS